MEDSYQGRGGRGRDGYDSYNLGRSRSGTGLDRGRDGPPPRNGGPPDIGGGRGFRGTPENAYTKMCMRWMAGECRFGDRCNFAHSEAELRRSHPRAREDEYGPPYQDGGRNGFHPRENSYSEGRGGYRDGSRDPPRREYDDYPGSRGERAPLYGGSRGGYSRDGVPPRSGSGYDGRDERDYPGRGDGSREYVPPSRSGADERGGGGGNARPKDDNFRPDYSEKPEGMTDEVWAGSGYPVPGPNAWWRYTTEQGEHYYHNYRTKETTWDKPEGWTIVAIPRT
eukprot:TRINITY_DN4018_c0_g1_i4.p3 TRINITY_DN4018_c0_g1~~TRINITY_DN4018_c0_g1_i4.p3  ORF type:complete len:317 (-),score=46.36 TRINITY_DN4018_c0_g1_i4:1871-2713(-)